MFGFGKRDPTQPQLLNTRETEDRLLELVKNARKQVVLVSPWVTLGRLGTLRRAMLSALERGVMIRLIIRRDEDAMREIVEEAKDLVLKGLTIQVVERLHAKIYWSESEALLTSVNLHESSFDKSVEFGLRIERGDLHSEILKMVDGFEVVTEGKKERFERVFGFCLLCGERIPMNPAKPFCQADAAQRWRLGDRELRCHRCGTRGEVSSRKPLCKGCYKAVAA